MRHVYPAQQGVDAIAVEKREEVMAFCSLHGQYCVLRQRECDGIRVIFILVRQNEMCRFQCCNDLLHANPLSVKGSDQTPHRGHVSEPGWILRP